MPVLEPQQAIVEEALPIIDNGVADAGANQVEVEPPQNEVEVTLPLITFDNVDANPVPPVSLAQNVFWLSPVPGVSIHFYRKK